jgi:hypothetical protein
MELRDVITKGIEKAKDYVAEKHLLPGEKDKYIAQLEADLEKKQKEIANLKRNRRRRSWRK